MRNAFSGLVLRSQTIDYLSFRLWVGLWIGLLLIILVALDASAYVCYITRFTEENFATLIAFIFIMKVCGVSICEIEDLKRGRFLTVLYDRVW